MSVAPADVSSAPPEAVVSSGQEAHDTTVPEAGVSSGPEPHDTTVPEALRNILANYDPEICKSTVTLKPGQKLLTVLEKRVHSKGFEDKKRELKGSTIDDVKRKEMLSEAGCNYLYAWRKLYRIK